MIFPKIAKGKLNIDIKYVEIVAIIVSTICKMITSVSAKIAIIGVTIRVITILAMSGVKITMSNAVEHPDHYKTGNYECIDVMLETQGAELTMNFCIGNAFKYLWRHRNKNGIEDVKKAKWYLEKYIELAEK